MWGFLNPSGRIQIIPIFDAISDFEDGYAQVIQGNNSNYIDKQGKLFLEFRN
ncbi:WG repeat-containing protein [Romboutsia ilealis]|nr:WG repeat-containing protein [Romboutsia ilealis]